MVYHITIKYPHEDINIARQVEYSFSSTLALEVITDLLSGLVLSRNYELEIKLSNKKHAEYSFEEMVEKLSHPLFVRYIHKVQCVEDGFRARFKGFVTLNGITIECKHSDMYSNTFFTINKVNGNEGSNIPSFTTEVFDKDKFAKFLKDTIGEELLVAKNGNYYIRSKVSFHHVKDDLYALMEYDTLFKWVRITETIRY